MSESAGRSLDNQRPPKQTLENGLYLDPDIVARDPSIKRVELSFIHQVEIPLIDIDQIEMRFIDSQGAGG